MFYIVTGSGMVYTEEGIRRLHASEEPETPFDEWADGLFEAGELATIEEGDDLVEEYNLPEDYLDGLRP